MDEAEVPMPSAWADIAGGAAGGGRPRMPLPTFRGEAQEAAMPASWHAYAQAPGSVAEAPGSVADAGGFDMPAAWQGLVDPDASDAGQNRTAFRHSVT